MSIVTDLRNLGVEPPAAMIAADEMRKTVLGGSVFRTHPK